MSRTGSSYSFHTRADAISAEGPKTAKRGSVKKWPPVEGQPVVRRTNAVLAHGLVKEDKVPGEELDRALARMRKFAASPERHTLAEG
jgi:hypothetical protein